MKQGQNGHAPKQDEEITRLMIQALGDMGYTGVMHALSDASGVRVESPVVLAFRQAMLSGSWQEALVSLQQLELADAAHHKAVLFLIYEQQFLEQLEQGFSSQALQTLRLQLTPLKHDRARLHFLSSLLMTAPTELCTKASWSGSSGDSRAALLRKVSRYIAPGSMMPERRLQQLLAGERQRQARACHYHTGVRPVSLLAAEHTCDRETFPLVATHILADHMDEVWHVQYSPRGRYLASASRDGQVILYETAGYKIKTRLQSRTLQVGQTSGVSHLAFSADEEMLLSCQQDNTLCIWDLKTGLLLNQLSHLHKEPPSAAVFVPDSSGRFLSGGLDKRIYLFSAAGEVLESLETGRIYDLQCTPDAQYFATIDTNAHLSVYALEGMKRVAQLDMGEELTSLAVSKDGSRLLVNVKPMPTGTAMLHEFSIPSLKRLRTLYEGPMQSQFVVRAGYGGEDEQFVLSGSEDGRIYVWHRESGTLLEQLEEHTQCAGSVCWRPGAQAEWASGSDDGTVRIWQTRSPE
ncbi:WD40-repeat-containing domain protein [Protomyces lactucae-debilis]|uniref:WD40-repeat-containing domain protein n=1 Tax=Protomyces lactucae-debilis TaxID=2754530 RepID=A0A1Y2F7Q1_PROLT|nr:WD40-repeat-containing domain protein [Protomyces lactucae-debilis]ORY78935.1 WD40-repeat-containing domain protein [Protomyces lactucae-debilis]